VTAHAIKHWLVKDQVLNLTLFQHRSRQTTISESAKTFDVASIDFEDDSPSSVTLSKLDSTNIWDRVSVDVKVLTVMDPVSVPGGKRKQDVMAADIISSRLARNHDHT